MARGGQHLDNVMRMGRNGGKIPQHEILLAVFRDNYWLARTNDGDPFATSFEVPGVMVPLKGKGGLRNRLAAGMWELTGKMPSQESQSVVTGILEGVATGARRTTPHLRVASRDGAMFLDLGRPDGATVAITPGRWHVVTRHPVLFKRTAMTGELPMPAAPGSPLGGVREMINIAGDDELALYMCCRIASLFPGITHPVEVMTGPAGSAKTSTTRLSANWIDPSEVMIPVPRDGRTWSSIAAARYTLPIDNVSFIPAWWSDLLCKAASGDGHVDRALYTDGDVYVSRFLSVIILNGITLGALRGDLADRIVGHALCRPAVYRSDDELAAQWEAAWPSALAWLLDRTAEIYADIASVPPPLGASRLARFEQIVACADARWGTDAAGAWKRSRGDVLEDVAEGDAVAVAIRAAVTQPVTLTSSELLSRLVVSGGLAEGRSPWTPKTLSEHVERSIIALASLGWQVWRSRKPHSGARVWNVVPPGWSMNGHGWKPVSGPSACRDAPAVQQSAGDAATV